MKNKYPSLVDFSNAININEIDSVKSFGDLNLQNDQELLDLTKLAAKLCQTSVAYISLIDGQKQTFIARVGVDLEETGTEMSFCRYMLPGTPIVVEDTHKDDRFRDHPWVRGDLSICFFVGVAIESAGGHKIGSCCVMDRNPRLISEDQMDSLLSISKHVSNIFKLRVAIKRLQEKNSLIEKSEIKLRAIYDSYQSYNFLFGHNLELIDFNKKSSDLIFKLFHKRLQSGIDVLSFFGPKGLKSFTQSFNKAISGEVVKVQRPIFSDIFKTEIWWDIVYSPARDRDEKIIGVSLNARDITLKKKYERKSIRQREQLEYIAQLQSHQVRGPVASIMGIMSLIKADGPSLQLLELLEASVNKLDKAIFEIVHHAHK